MTLVVVCTPSGDGVPVHPCGLVDGQAMAPALFDMPMLSESTVAAVEAAAAPFDYGEASQFWTMAFGLVLLFFVVGITVGTILRVLRD